MNTVAYHAQMMDQLIKELTGSALEKPKPLPKATDWAGVTCVELPNGWDLEVGYVWSHESVDDAPEVQVVEAALCTPVSRITLKVGDIRRFVGDVEEQIAEEIEERERKEAEAHHRAGCRCRDCADDRGDHDYHARKDDQA